MIVYQKSRLRPDILRILKRLQGSALQFLQRIETTEERPSPRPPYSGDLFERRTEHVATAEPGVVRERETMRFVTNSLYQAKRRGVPGQEQ